MGSTRRSWAKNPLQGVVLWVKRQPIQRKTLLGVLAAFVTLIFLRFAVRDHDNLFVASECVHAAGALVLIYKLSKEKNYAGLSLKSQYLTTLFLAVRLWCSFVMEYNTHTILDTITLLFTLWVIYTIRFKLKATIDQSTMAEKDNMPVLYLVIPCALLAVFVHPQTSHSYPNRVLWAFCVYLESISVLPQLRVMQNWKLVEPFTAHYVFALGVARFLSCAHWVLQMIDQRSMLLGALGSYGLWPPAVLLSEIVQTFILADFCYYYVKSAMDGQMMVRLPSGVV